MAFIIYNPTDKIRFGAYEGALMSEIFKYHPDYIVWAVKKKDDFAINVKAFEQLPKPAPVITKGFYGYEPVFFKLYVDKFNVPFDGKVWAFHTGNELLVLIEEFIKAGKYKPCRSNFAFSDEIKKINQEKIDENYFEPYHEELP